jgi:hypothetical protein
VGQLVIKNFQQNEIDFLMDIALKTRLVHKILDGKLIKQVALEMTQPINCK